MIRFYFALASFLLAAPLHAGARPNVVFILSDDQRADTIAALGNKQIKTPALDRLVKNGTFFSRAYCMGGMQGAICVPSRAMILSGRTLFRVRENLDKQTTWPEVLTRLGYATFMTGKWHNGRPSALRSFQLGDSVFFGGMGNPLALPVADFARGAKVRDLGKSAKHAAVQFADEAVAFIKKQKRGQPFLAYVAFTSPHDPRVATKELHDYYDAHKPPLPANFLPVHPFDNGEMTVRDEKLLPWPRTEKDVRQALADYYACITLMDAQVGRILAALEEAGLLENTIIIFASDHGLAIGSHGLLGKQNLYDHSMRAPLIVAGPGLPKGKNVRRSLLSARHLPDRSGPDRQRDPRRGRGQEPRAAPARQGDQAARVAPLRLSRRAAFGARRALALDPLSQDQQDAALRPRNRPRGARGSGR
ncbi:MAG: sulfatase-like hydrolase/transferase [Gemmataceae bacterium]